MYLLQISRKAIRIAREIRAGRGAYPIMRKEQAFLERMLGGYGVLLDKFGGLSLASLMVLPFAWLVFPQLFLFHILLIEAFGLLICAAGSAAIVREKQMKTWDTLRISTLSMQEILIGKLLGVLSLTEDGMRLLAKTRLWGTLVTLPMFFLFFSFPNAGGLGVVSPGLVLPLLLAAALVFILHPVLHTRYSAQLSVGISLIARRESTAASASLILYGFLLVLGLIPGWFAVQRGVFDPLFLKGAAGQKLLADFNWLIPLAFLTLFRSFVGLVFGAGAFTRAGKL